MPFGTREKVTARLSVATDYIQYGPPGKEDGKAENLQAHAGKLRLGSGQAMSFTLSASTRSLE